MRKIVSLLFLTGLIVGCDGEPQKKGDTGRPPEPTLLVPANIEKLTKENEQTVLEFNKSQAIAEHLAFGTEMFVKNLPKLENEIPTPSPKNTKPWRSFDVELEINDPTVKLITERVNLGNCLPKKILQDGNPEAKAYMVSIFGTTCPLTSTFEHEREINTVFDEAKYQLVRADRKESARADFYIQDPRFQDDIDIAEFQTNSLHVADSMAREEKQWNYNQKILVESVYHSKKMGKVQVQEQIVTQKTIHQRSEKLARMDRALEHLIEFVDKGFALHLKRDESYEYGRLKSNYFLNGSEVSAKYYAKLLGITDEPRPEKPREIPPGEKELEIFPPSVNMFCEIRLAREKVGYLCAVPKEVRQLSVAKDGKIYEFSVEDHPKGDSAYKMTVRVEKAGGGPIPNGVAALRIPAVGSQKVKERLLREYVDLKCVQVEDATCK